MQVLSNQELSLTLSNELRLKQRLLDEEQKTTDKLIQVSLFSDFDSILIDYIKSKNSMEPKATF